MRDPSIGPQATRSGSGRMPAPGLFASLVLRRRDTGQQSIAHLAVVLVALALAFALVLPDGALSLSTLQSMMYQLPELAFLSLAMSIALISGGLNLAIVATANAAGLLMAGVIVHFAAPGLSDLQTLGVVAMAAVLGMCLCIAIGIATGWLIAVLGVHPLLVTIGTMSVITGISVSLTDGRVISGFPPVLLGLSNQLVLGMPISFLMMLAAFAVIAFVLSRTSFGQTVFMIGSNIESTRYSGISPLRVLIGVYVTSSVLCWAAALVMMARFNSASAGYADSYLLITILAAVLGGIDPFGGFGRIGGLLLSLVILQMISTSFNLLGLDQQLTMVIWGAILIGVLTVSRVRIPRFGKSFRARGGVGH